jgi:hypothetical protein
MAEFPDQTANSLTMKDDDGLSASSKDVARDQWSSVVRTQIHFNEIIHRTRQLTMTAVAAAFGAAFASFATKTPTNLTIEAFQLSVPSATLLVVLGWTFLLIGYLMDRVYYYKLLLSAVAVGEELENTYDLPAKLTTALSKKVSRRRANIVIHLFYAGAFLAGLVLFPPIYNSGYDGAHPSPYTAGSVRDWENKCSAPPSLAAPPSR